jgi:hypothetical protein
MHMVKSVHNYLKWLEQYQHGFVISANKALNVIQFDLNGGIGYSISLFQNGVNLPKY